MINEIVFIAIEFQIAWHKPGMQKRTETYWYHTEPGTDGKWGWSHTGSTQFYLIT